MDIGGLDAVVLDGYPGTVASMWQQAGRAGRQGEPSLAVLVGKDDPLDAYLLHHPARSRGVGVATPAARRRRHRRPCRWARLAPSCLGCRSACVHPAGRRGTLSRPG
jgi:hypothetical protein